MRAGRSLYTTLALGLMAVLLLIGVLYSLVASTLTAQLQERASQQLNHDLAQNLVADNRIVQNGEVNEKALKETFMAYMSINPSIEIYYLDMAGEILSYSAEPGSVKLSQVDLSPVRSFLSGGAKFPLLGDDPRSTSDKKAFSVAPIPTADSPSGYLYVVLHGEQFTEARAAQEPSFGLGMSLLAVFASLWVGLLMGLILFQRISQRLKRLQNSVRDFSDNGFKHHQQSVDNVISVPQKGDEIDELSYHFSQMQDHISQQWHSLAQQDHLRREMIASLSHDLRTPLASVQGYLETLSLKGESLTIEQQQNCIDIALKQTHRLQSLMDQLFQLVKLEAPNASPDCEPFSILELVYDVVEKFSPIAKDKGIALSVNQHMECTDVLADISLIERVLDNLLGNALHYVPSGKHIWIDVAVADDGKVAVSVNDDGPGIPKPAQALVFQSFHRADNPQRSSTGHAGLGLAIVKKILELHQENIWLDSEPGQGAHFTFTLSAIA